MPSGRDDGSANSPCPWTSFLIIVLPSMVLNLSMPSPPMGSAYLKFTAPADGFGYAATVIALLAFLSENLAYHVLSRMFLL